MLDQGRLLPPAAPQPKPIIFSPKSACFGDTDDDNDDASDSDGDGLGLIGDGHGAAELSSLRLTRGYELCLNAWDVVVCVGHPSIGSAGSWMAGIIACLNVLIQVVFCFIIATAFQDDPYDDDVRAALKWWRLGMAHSADQVDAVTGTSLASRICRFDKALGVSAIQLKTAADITEYGWQWTGAGPVVCAIAVLCWYLIIASEMHGVIRFSLAVWCLPRGDTRILEGAPGGELQLASIAPRRRAAVLLVQFIRLLVAIALGVYGGHFLVYTTTPQELVLNAVALEFVMDIDELLFRVAAPSSVQALLTRVREVPIPQMRQCKGANFTAIVMFVTPVLVCAWTVLFELAPAITARQQAWDSLCGGSRQFVVATDGLGRPHWSSTEPYVRGQRYRVDGVMQEAVELVRGNRTDLASSLLVQDPNLDELTEETSQSVAQASSGLECSDADAGHAPASASSVSRPWTMGRGILQALTGNESLAACPDVAPFCLLVGLVGIRARQWCPVTCGCHSPRSGLLIDQPSLGCPGLCADAYRAESGLVHCREQSLQDTSQDDGFMAYVRGIQAVFVQRGFEAPGLVALADQMLARGCQAVADGGRRAEPLCTGSMAFNGTTTRHFRSVRDFCPVACGCDGSGLPGAKRDFWGAAPKYLSTVLAWEGECFRRSFLTSQYVLLGMADNRAPVYRSPSGYFIYYGPDCSNSEVPQRWIVSPMLCNRGFADAFIASEDRERPPEKAEWRMRCTSGWEYVTVTLRSVVQDAAASVSES